MGVIDVEVETGTDTELDFDTEDEDVVEDLDVTEVGGAALEEGTVVEVLDAVVVVVVELDGGAKRFGFGGGVQVVQGGGGWSP